MSQDADDIKPRVSADEDILLEPEMFNGIPRLSETVLGKGLDAAASDLAATIVDIGGQVEIRIQLGNRRKRWTIGEVMPPFDTDFEDVSGV